MTTGSPSNTLARDEVTRLLRRWQEGEGSLDSALVDLVHPELERIARRALRRERAGHTLDSQALVNEAYLRLIDQDRIHWAGRAQFYAVAAQAMRRILVDYARRKKSHKRGGEVARVELDEAQHSGNEGSVDVLGLDEALKTLGTVDAVKCQVVELRFFGGFSHEEIAEILGVSLSTVERHWRMARAWLYDALQRS